LKEPGGRGRQEASSTTAIAAKSAVCSNVYNRSAESRKGANSAERNPARANLAACAQDWRWSILGRRLITVRRLCSSRFWVRTVLIAARLTVSRQPHDEYETDTRNQADQVPPSASAGVVKPADRNRDVRNEYSQGIETSDYTSSAEIAVDGTEHDRDDEVEKKERPELGPTSPSAEHRILLQYIKIPMHGASVMVDRVDMVG